MTTFKTLAVLILLLGSTSRIQENYSNRYQQPAHQPRSPSSSIEAHPYTDKKEDSSKTKKDDSLFCRWLSILGTPLLSNWPLVVIGIFGTLAALRTLRAIKRQGDIMETGMRQWVVINNWTNKLGETTEKNRLYIYFQIVNPTKLPISLEAANMNINAKYGSHYGLKYMLAPDESYGLAPSVVLSPDQILKLSEDYLSLDITGTIHYRDAFNRTADQPISGVLVCVKEACKFYPRSMEGNVLIRSINTQNRGGQD
jgi:hypothetical protein